VKEVFFDFLSGSGIVLLTDLEEKKVLPIWVGIFEAQSIQMKMKGNPVQRPVTHDLLKNIIEDMGHKVVRVEIHDIVENTYYARIVLGGKQKERLIDSRPSDAIALAVRADCPVFLAEHLYEKAQKKEEFESSLKEEFYKKYLESLEEEELKKA